MTSVVLQQDTELYFTTVDPRKTSTTVSSYNPVNTVQLKPLSGFALDLSSNDTTFTPNETGLATDRAIRVSRQSLNPAAWNFSFLFELTGSSVAGPANAAAAAGRTQSGYILPLEDGFLWQNMVSNTAAKQGTDERSVWRTGGVLETKPTANAVGMAASVSNWKKPPLGLWIMKQSNVVSIVDNVAIDTATVSVGTEGVAQTDWTGVGTNIEVLEGAARDKVISVVGGILNNGTSVAANSAVADGFASGHYKEANKANVNGTVVDTARLNQQLSTVTINNENTAGTNVNYPDDAAISLEIIYSNNLTSATPEVIGELNRPLPAVRGARSVTGTVVMYFRKGTSADPGTADLFNDLVGDDDTNTKLKADVALTVGDKDGDHVTFFLGATQFSLPTLNFNDATEMSIPFTGQEPTADEGTGGELKITVTRTS